MVSASLPCLFARAWAPLRLTAAAVIREDMFPVFTEHARDLVALLGEQRPGQRIDLQPLFFAYTMDAFCAIAFGQKLNTVRSPHPFAVSFDYSQFVVKTRTTLPRPVWRTLKVLGMGMERRMEGSIRVINDFALEVGGAAASCARSRGAERLRRGRSCGATRTRRPRSCRITPTSWRVSSSTRTRVARSSPRPSCATSS